MKAALITLLVAATVTGDAKAATFPGQRPDTSLDTQAAAALQRWAARGVTGCPAGVRGWLANSLYDDRDQTDPAGRGEDCEFWVSSRIRRMEPWNQPAEECTIVEHEVGHALGLAHSDADRFPSMAAAGAIMSSECLALVRWDLLPRPERVESNRKRARCAARRDRARALSRARRAERRAGLKRRPVIRRDVSC